MVYKRNEMGIKERAELEAAMMRNERNAANIDYVAMMADVELPDEEQEGEENEQ